jgi:hypothetical protein
MMAPPPAFTPLDHAVQMHLLLAGCLSALLLILQSAQGQATHPSQLAIPH